MREASDDKRIVIIQGDITEQDCEALVNAAKERSGDHFLRR
jgi:O-acetyl-ADP-ribose deacetylase (regulator of RNase III)